MLTILLVTLLSHKLAALAIALGGAGLVGMAVPQGVAGRGSQLQTSPDSVNYTTIAQLQKFDPSGADNTMEDATCCDSPGVANFPLPTLQKTGEITMSGIDNSQDPTKLNLEQLFLNQTQEYFKIVRPGGSHGYTFQGYVSKYVPLKVDYSKLITFDATITVFGALTPF